MANDLPQAPIVMIAVELGAKLLEEGAAEEALENFKTAVRLNEPFVSELLSDDQKVAKRAAARRLPPDTDLLTYTTSPLCHLYRLLRLRGDAQAAFLVGAKNARDLHAARALLRRGRRVPRRGGRYRLSGRRP